MGKKELKAILAKHSINATDDELQQMIDLISLNGTCVHFLNKSSNIENKPNYFGSCSKIKFMLPPKRKQMKKYNFEKKSVIFITLK